MIRTLYNGGWSAIVSYQVSDQDGNTWLNFLWTAIPRLIVNIKIPVLHSKLTSKPLVWTQFSKTTDSTQE